MADSSAPPSTCPVCGQEPSRLDEARVCPACGRDLGKVLGPTLALEDVAVLVTPRGVVVTCPDCRTERLWTQKRSA